jgi:exodeoxyribonuclease-3
MRIATWNVNSLKARLEKVAWWLERAAPDVLLMQETKLSDDNAPQEEFARLGYELAHHGQGRWNGVAIASKVGLSDVIVNFAEPFAQEATHEAGDDEPLAEARMVTAICGGLRVASIYAPNGRSLDSVFYRAKLSWFDRLVRFLEARSDTRETLVLGGDFNVAPTDQDVWEPALCHGGTHVSAPERARFDAVMACGLVDAYRLRHSEPERFSWWDYRAGAFHKNLGMRIDHLLVSAPLAPRVVDAEIDREARKGKPVPSDHAPVFLDLDEPGRTLDAGWRAAEKRIAVRRSSPR